MWSSDGSSGGYGGTWEIDWDAYYQAYDVYMQQYSDGSRRTTTTRR